MICKDPAVAYLNQLNYCAIRTPDESITPLTVLAGDKRGVENFGLINKFVRDVTLPLPPLQQNLPTVEMEKTASDKVESKVGFDLLKGFLEKLKMGSGGVHLNLSPQNKVSFHFKECFKDRVAPADLVTYLDQAAPTEVSALQEYIDKKGEAHVIYETIKSDSFSVSFYDETNTAVQVDGIKINDIIDANAGIEIKKESETKLTFKGEKLLPFGFKSLTFWLSTEKRKMVFKTRLAGEVIMRDMEEKPVFQNLLVEIL